MDLDDLLVLPELVLDLDKDLRCVVDIVVDKRLQNTVKVRFRIVRSWAGSRMLSTSSFIVYEHLLMAMKKLKTYDCPPTRSGIQRG